MTTMEDLTKTQIVLLTLLVSFITSIATGIITTSLLAQAPASVTQTIDRVVERTVESAGPSSTGNPVKDVTVVSEDDAVVGAISSATKSLVRIMSPADPDGTQSLYALGVIVNKQGQVLSDKRSLRIGDSYTAVLSDGTTLLATVVRVSDNRSLTLFNLQGIQKTITPITLSQADPKLGQTVIALQGKDNNSVSVGRVLATDSTLSTFTTDFNTSKEIQGSPVVDLNGELVGLKTSNADLTLPEDTYTSASSIAKFIAGN